MPPLDLPPPYEAIILLETKYFGCEMMTGFPTAQDIVDMILKGFLNAPLLTETAELYPALSGSDAIALLLVSRSEGSKMSTIADSLKVPMSTASGIMTRLARKGFIARTHGTEDRRVITVELTDKGREVVDQFYGSVQTLFEQLATGMTGGEIIELFSLTEKAFTILSQPKSAKVKIQPALRRIEIE